jgi:Myosin head (motor domain)
MMQRSDIFRTGITNSIIALNASSLQAAILYNLKARHVVGKPYTRTGDIVIAVNVSIYEWHGAWEEDSQKPFVRYRLTCLVFHSNRYVLQPYQWLNELYTEKQQMLYANKLVWDKTDTDQRKKLEPHVYETSALCYKGLATQDMNQSILVSGESGAGTFEFGMRINQSPWETLVSQN